MAILEQYIIDGEGRKRVIFEDTEAKQVNEFDEYQEKYAKATTWEEKAECNKWLRQKIRERYPL